VRRWLDWGSTHDCMALFYGEFYLSNLVLLTASFLCFLTYLFLSWKRQHYIYNNQPVEGERRAYGDFLNFLRHWTCGWQEIDGPRAWHHVWQNGKKQTSLPKCMGAGAENTWWRVFQWWWHSKIASKVVSIGTSSPRRFEWWSFDVSFARKQLKRKWAKLLFEMKESGDKIHSDEHTIMTVGMVKSLVDT
jgi:hypothetical protein